MNAQIKQLSSEAGKLYRKIRRQWDIRDEPGLTLLLTACQALDRMREAQKLLTAEGIVKADRFGQDKPHPASQIEKESRAGLLQALKGLNLDLDSLEANSATEKKN